MQKFSITGGKALHGELKVSGAKNSALPILAATLLTDKPVRISNIPHLSDIITTVTLLARMGVKLTVEAQGAIEVSSRDVKDFIAPYELVRTMRASILVLGPLLARFGKARVSLPGGCAFGARPIDVHLAGLKAMGADIDIVNGYVEASVKTRLQGTHLLLDKVTVNGTQNLMMAATLAEGTTIIENAACEPEVIDLANFLNLLGAKVKGAGTNRIEIEGVTELKGGQYHLIPDRIEAGTFLIAAAMTGGYIKLQGIHESLLEAVLVKLVAAGAVVKSGEDWISLDRRDRKLIAVDITTTPYPGIPTDMQAQLLAMNTVAQGCSMVTETIFENRFMHVQELVRLGANIKLQGNTALITGVDFLTAAPVMATDLRASAGLVLAALVARGETVIDRIYHIDRGYECIDEKLLQLGAVTRRLKS